MTQHTSTLDASDRLHLSTATLSTATLLKETKILFNHDGSDAELAQQIAIAVEAISALNEKRAA